jgi:homoserine O-acetyltransferase/O-succinyltransferase
MGEGPYVRCRTDKLFPPAIAPAVMKNSPPGVEARYFEVDSKHGHSASGPEHAKWSPVLRELLTPLVAGLG